MSALAERPLVAASAPGKLMISGEYAVLDGAVAVVAAVDVRVHARWVDGGEVAPLPPEAAETRRLAELALGRVDGTLQIEAGDLRRAGRKLGLGSSAAASAAVAGALLASCGHDLREPAVIRRALELALAGHRAVAPEGSGADVAASTLGGFVRFRLEGGKLAEAAPVIFPALAKRVVWTGKEARTSDFVRAVRLFEQRDSHGFALLRSELCDRAARFADAITRGDVRETIAATGAYGLAMGQLGRSAGVAIVTPELSLIARLAEQHGGAAKPSGAGGGDVAIALFPDETSALAFDAACAAEKLERLPLGLGAPGLRTA